MKVLSSIKVKNDLKKFLKVYSKGLKDNKPVIKSIKEDIEILDVTDVKDIVMLMKRLEKKLAKEKGIEGYTSMKKAELLEKLA